MDNTMDNSMDWNSGLANPEQRSFEAPAIGEYNFTVVSFEKTVSKAGNRMAKICIELEEKGGHCRIYDYLVLQEKFVWKIAAFFESLGLKERGADLKVVPWDKVMGSTGRVRIKHEEYDGVVEAKVDRYVWTDRKDEKPEEVVEEATEADSGTEGSLPFEI